MSCCNLNSLYPQANPICWGEQRREGIHSFNRRTDELNSENQIAKTAKWNLVTVRNVKVDDQEANDTLTKKAGQIVKVVADVSLDFKGFGPYVIDQVIVGLEPTDGRTGTTPKGMGAQECILHQRVFNVKPFTAQFDIKLPNEPGTYDIRFHNKMEYTPQNAMKQWTDKTSGSGIPPKEATIATIVVK